MEKKRVIMKVNSQEEMNSCIKLLTALFDEGEIVRMDLAAMESLIETEQYEILITVGQENTVTVIGDAVVDLINEKF